jgi:predicted GNAT family N-acyltransferase
MVETIVDYARARGARAGALNAQETVSPFSERLEFVTNGQSFIEAGTPHRRMTRRWGAL